MITHWKDEQGSNWYKFIAKDIDMLLPAMEDVKFEEIVDEEERRNNDRA